MGEGSPVTEPWRSRPVCDQAQGRRVKHVTLVLDAVEAGYATSHAIAVVTGVPWRSVTAWLSKLAKTGVIVCCGIADDGFEREPGRATYRWRLRRPTDLRIPRTRWKVQTR